MAARIGLPSINPVAASSADGLVPVRSTYLHSTPVKPASARSVSIGSGPWNPNGVR